MAFKSLGQKPNGTRLARIHQSKQYRDGMFQNQSLTPMGLEGVSSAQTMASFVTSRSRVSPPQALEVVKADLKALEGASPTVIWFGHSSYLINYLGKTILVDPVFSTYASPVPALIKAFAGTNAFSVDELPEIDLLFITHDHYDHLDYATMVALKKKVKHVCASLGVGQHLSYWGYSEALITELDWWEEAELMGGDAKVTATPARHFSGRGLARNQTLWSSFVLMLGHYRFFLGGDSGYDAHFKLIGERFGPFDLALVECGQYHEGWPSIHAFPEQSAQAGIDLKTKVMLPVHWAKFPLAFHSWTNPIERVLAAAATLDLSLVTPRIGEPFTIGGLLPQTAWWR